jgi:hypothetical protein
MIRIVLPIVLFATAAALGGDTLESPTTALQAPDTTSINGRWCVLSESYVLQRGHLLKSTANDSSWYDFDWTFSGWKATEYLFSRCGSQSSFRCEYRLNPDRHPMWLDLIIGGKEVELGCAKFKGSKLTWVRGQRVPLARWQKAAGQVAERPRHFDATKSDAGAALLVLERIP